MAKILVFYRTLLSKAVHTRPFYPTFTAVTGVRIPLGTPLLKNTIDAQGFFVLIVPPDATAGKSGTLSLPFRASNSGAAAASSLARFAFLV
jgi:hypothetical protein